ncbi:dna2/nam7 helicase family [Holotrichia oblita]|uniref:Dna2/nam7 helicase family n=1 Tax=Holotrichia oblita TaxID=644536 RepID=A0ACB9TWE5_HOLOL|nr:dna2/nam7 helicase family [Holotrichia oblita]
MPEFVVNAAHEFIRDPYPFNHNISLEDAYDTLKSDNTIENQVNQIDDDDILEYTCYHRTGTVTSIRDNGILIDNKYLYRESNLGIAVGTKVSYVCYTTNNETKITNFNIIDNEWNCANSNEQRNWCYRTVIGKVIKRDKRNVYIDPDDIVVNLNNVNSEFIPIVGDWVELDVISEIDENVTDLSGNILKVYKINPLRHRVVEGNVKTWDISSRTGTINFNIFFDRESLCVGYIPVLKDKVVAEIIESEQGKCTWRALKVLSAVNGNITQSLNTVTSQYINNNIDISDDVHIEFTNVNDIVNFKFEIKNIRSSAITLNAVIIENISHQCKIFNSLPINISPNETISVEGECIIKMAGYSNETIIFEFDLSTTENSRSNNRQELISNSRAMVKFMQNDGNIIRAPKPFVPARFVPYRLPDYPIPTKLWEVFLKYDDGLTIDELKNILPVLTEVLSFQNYEKRFHTLLHLEEINSIIEIRKFDRNQIPFIRNGEYLMLEYENLSEQRPSIIVGDIIIAKDSLSNISDCYEGFVYKVCAKHVYLKFNSQFHDGYKGDDYSVSVIQSRTQYRRMHQAVGLAVKNLGRKFLFPMQITTVEPQINFTYDNYEDVLEKTSKTKRLSNSELMKIMQSTTEKSQDKKDKLSPNKKVVRTKKNSSFETLKLDWFDKSLNYYQKEAVRHILLGEARPHPYFVFGPPGTGKTVTLVETILQILRMAPSRILVATPSNSAANLISMRLIKSGVLKPGDLVRLVSYKSINDNTIPPNIAPYCATINVGANGTGSGSSMVTDSGLTIGLNSKTIGKHRVTVSTCTSIGALYSMSLSKGQFSHIVIDEAGQATEPEIMIPLSFLDMSSGQCILAGDPMQLGPVVCSKYATEFGLCESFMERLLNRFPYIRDVESFTKTGGYDPKLVTKLVYNYRSLPGVLELPNSMFYFSELKPTMREIRSVFAEAEFDIPKVGTVEEFQGQEFKVIILSTVRSNKNMLACDRLHNLGFVTQPKRLNVALTRAQILTIVVGNPYLLINDSSWRYIIQFAVKNGCYCGCDISTL